jgi:hypothetical protein
MSAPQITGSYDPSIMVESYAQWEKSLEIEIQQTFNVANRNILESNMARDLSRLKHPQVDPDFLCTWTVRSLHYVVIIFHVLSFLGHPVGQDLNVEECN